MYQESSGFRNENRCHGFALDVNQEASVCKYLSENMWMFLLSYLLIR